MLQMEMNSMWMLMSQFIFRSPKRNNSWVIFDDVDITINVTGFLIEITCTYTN